MSTSQLPLRAIDLPVLPGTVGTGSTQVATLGVMGGGQLGRMFVHAAQRMGFFTAVLDPDPQSPAGRVSHHHVQTAYDDATGLAHLSQLCDAITTEFENVPALSLQTLAAQRPVAPGAQAVAVAQNRIEEKSHFVASGVPCAPYAVIENAEQLATLDTALLPGILKTARMGYDGKGQVRVANAAELAAAWEDLKRVPCVLEKMLPLKAECSVLLARGWDGQIVAYPAQRNVHVDGILAVTHAYVGNLPAALAARALAAAQSIARQIDYVGVLCVEFFVVDDGSPEGDLIVNEIAPRPHNSGHYTMDACSHSQFDLQVYSLAGLALPELRQHSPAIMLNLLGDVWQDAAGKPRTPDWQAVLALPGTHLHLYGKLAARPGRKMGHLNITAEDIPSLLATTRQVAELLGLPGLEQP